MYGEYLGNKMGNLGGAAFDKHMIRSICIEDRLQFFKKNREGEREREKIGQITTEKTIKSNQWCRLHAV
jgi:hypothetical protein